MSLRLRIGSLLEMSFTLNTKGLSLKDLERIIQIHEGEYFYLSDAQHGIVDGMAFMKKPILERRNLTKPSFYNRESFWKWGDGKYFLVKGQELSKNAKSGLDSLDSGILQLEDKLDYLVFCEDKLIDILDKNKNGMELKRFLFSFGDFAKKFGSLDDEEKINKLFSDFMHFDRGHPYETVYLDKHAPGGVKYDEFSWAEESFTQWDYKNGLYFPNDDFLKNIPQFFKEPEKAKEFFIERIEHLTLLKQILDYCRGKNLSNSEFLRMYSLMIANLDASRKEIYKT